MLSSGQLSELNCIQRKCITQIDSSVAPCEAYRKLKILTVSQLVELEQSKMGYKLCKGMLPMAVTELMMCDVNNQSMAKTHAYETRQKSVPNRPNVKSKLYMDSFLYRSIACYSNWSPELRNAPSLASFVRLVKQRLLETN